MDLDERIQTAAERDALITGTQETIKKMADVDTVILARNTPPDLAAKVEAAAEDHDVPVQKLTIDNDDLGALCMKPYAASVIGLTDDN